MMRALCLQQLDRGVKSEPLADAQRQLSFALQVFIDEEDLPTGIVLSGGDAPARGISQGQFSSTATASGTRRRNLRLHQSSRCFAQNAGGLATGIVINAAALRSLRLCCHTTGFEGGRVRNANVAIHTNEYGRMIKSVDIEVLAAGQF